MKTDRTNNVNPAVFFGLAMAASGAISANPILTLTAGACFAAIWWGAVGHPFRSVFASLLSAQWVQASAKLWMANAWGVSLDQVSTTSLTSELSINVTETTGAAISLGLACIALMSVGARLSLPRLRLASTDFDSLSPNGIALLYVPLLIVSRIPQNIFGDSLSQLVTAAGSLRYAPIALLVGVWFFSKRGGLILAAIVLLEVMLGLLEYFSAWKQALIVVGVSLVSIAGRDLRRATPFLVGGFVALIVMGTVWTIIKPEYRSQLNQGTGQQVTLLTPGQQGAAISSEISQIEGDDLSNGFVQLIQRISYVDYLADAMSYVPSQIPYQNGVLWGEALQQFVTPRFLFPDKAALPSDSERTMRFTGRRLASGAQGTSISIGYVGDTYVDFGSFGALLGSLALGLIFGLSARALSWINRGRDPVILFALAMPLVWYLQQFEISNTKLVGAFAWSFISCALFLLAWPRIESLISAKRNNSRAGYVPA